MREVEAGHARASLLPLGLALLAAALFGAATPASKWLLDALTPLQLAGLLYLGAALGVAPLALRGGAAGALPRDARERAAGSAAVVVFGGVLGPGAPAARPARGERRLGLALAEPRARGDGRARGARCSATASAARLARLRRRARGAAPAARPRRGRRGPRAPAPSSPRRACAGASTTTGRRSSTACPPAASTLWKGAVGRRGEPRPRLVVGSLARAARGRRGGALARRRALLRREHRALVVAAHGLGATRAQVVVRERALLRRRALGGLPRRAPRPAGARRGRAARRLARARRSATATSTRHVHAAARPHAPPPPRRRAPRSTPRRPAGRRCATPTGTSTSRSRTRTRTGRTCTTATATGTEPGPAAELRARVPYASRAPRGSRCRAHEALHSRGRSRLAAAALRPVRAAPRSARSGVRGRLLESGGARRRRRACSTSAAARARSR